jgi:hypothetical protein
MKRMFKLDLEKAFPPGVAAEVSDAEREAMMEVAYLAIAADGVLADEELDAFVRAMLVLYGPQVNKDSVRAKAGELSERASARGHEALLAGAAARLSRPFARDQAYKLAYAMAMADYDTNTCEFEYDQRLRSALGLTEDQAEGLVDEVIGVFESAP